MGETQNDLDFAKQLSKHFPIFVNDAFGVLHRNDASVTVSPFGTPAATP